MTSLLLAAVLSCPGQVQAKCNLNFEQGTLAGWQGSGFYLTTTDPRGPSLRLGVCSSDAGAPKLTGQLRYAFYVPEGAGMLRFSAYAARPKDCVPDHRLDVRLVDQSGRALPKRVRSDKGWTLTGALLLRDQGKARDYAWNIAGHAGQVLQVVVLDKDERPGCHVFSTGFRLEPLADFEIGDFVQHMLVLERKHSLPSMSRYDSKRFTALSNATEAFTVQRLRNCELLYDLFFRHFTAKGFGLRHPNYRLMVAAFDGPAGYDAYLERKMPPGVTGMYHQHTNRLIVYDQNQNAYLLAERERALKKSQKIKSAADRVKFVDAVERFLEEEAKDSNLGTIMHEVAHQVSFNCGLFNRDGDVAFWLAEGLACYCEATQSGEWRGLGEANPLRLEVLDRVRGGRFIPLQRLIVADDWLESSGSVLLAYGQSWALFHMLMHQQPRELRQYLVNIYPRQSPDSRLDDFRIAFGADLSAFERRYHAYMRDLLQKHPSR